MYTKKLENNEIYSALVVEGGAMRGIFSTGVLVAFIEKSFNPFDICIGVSAGATNIAAYLAGMYKRNYRVYTDYSLRPEFINWFRFIRGGHLIDLDWMWDITIDFIRKPPEDVRIFEVIPPKEFRTQRLTKDIPILEQDYKLGYMTGLDMIEKWNREME